MPPIPILNESGNPLPAYQTPGSAGMDLTAHLPGGPITLQPLERAAIPTGLRIAIPPGYEGQVRPRSGLALKRGLTVINAPGTIDSDYRGEVMVALVNLSGEPQTIADGERIAQLVVARYEQADWVVVSALDDTARGAGGFGHTGG